MKLVVAGDKSRIFANQDAAELVLVAGEELLVHQFENGHKQLRIGYGKDKNKINTRSFERLCRNIIVKTKEFGIKNLFINIDDFEFSEIDFKDSLLYELIIINFCLADYEYNDYKTSPEEGFKTIDTLIIDGSKKTILKKAVEKAEIIAKEVNSSRSLANAPGSDMTPEVLAKAAQKAAKGTSIKVKVLGEDEIKKLGMGGVLGVGYGSELESKLIVMEYYGKGKGKGKPVVLVGKGVTYDSGGLSLKPAEAMFDMWMDMTGASSVIHTMCAVARLGLKKNIIAVIPAVENMPSERSLRPGDILKMMSGKTVEVLNTDAEGRLILADGVTYAQKFDPRLIITVATLTGGAVIACGLERTAMFVNDEVLAENAKEYEALSAESVWRLPLADEFRDMIKSKRADIKNIGGVRAGHASQGAAFIESFVDEYKWMHLDIAPTMTSVEGEHLATGAKGTPIRYLVKLLEKY